MAGQGSAKLASKHYLFPGDSNYVGDGSPIGLPFQVLAEEFVNWLGVRSFMMRSSMVELCSSKGITLSFAPVPPGSTAHFNTKRKSSFPRKKLLSFPICTLSCTNSGKCWNAALPISDMPH